MELPIIFPYPWSCPVGNDHYTKYGVTMMSDRLNLSCDPTGDRFDKISKALNRDARLKMDTGGFG